MIDIQALIANLEVELENADEKIQQARLESVLHYNMGKRDIIKEVLEGLKSC